MPNGSKAFRAAPISEPINMVPVVSTVTWAIKTMSLPDLLIASRAPLTAALACNKSCVVSINKASLPPSINPFEASS